jgi:DNA-binding beta-propeller fold protein YncE
VGHGPNGVAYDPVNHDMYVVNSNSHNISIIGGTCTHVGTVTLGPKTSPQDVVFDPANNRLYVTDEHFGKIYEIAGMKVVATVHGFFEPTVEVYDPGDNVVAVAVSGSGEVAFIRGTTVVATDPVGGAPVAVGYDPYFATILVVNFSPGTVSIFNAINLTYESTVFVGYNPDSIAFDPANDYDYIGIDGASNLTVIYGDGTLVGQVTGFTVPEAIAFNQANLHIYVTNDGSSTGVVDQVTGTSIVGSNTTSRVENLLGIAYDEYNDYMYVTDYSTTNVYILT